MTANVTRVTVAKVTKLRNSPGGNPRWQIESKEGHRLVTRMDSSVAFEISEELVDHVVDLNVDGDGHVYGIERVWSE